MLVQYNLVLWADLVKSVTSEIIFCTYFVSKGQKVKAGFSCDRDHLKLVFFIA